MQQHLAEAAARDKIAVYLNNDPGSGATYGWYMANNAAARAIFDAWLEPLKDLGLKRNVMDSNFTSEDGVFDGVGIPAFTTIMDYTNYDARTRHTNVDFYEAVSEKDLQQSAIVMAVFAYQSCDARSGDSAAAGRCAGEPASGDRSGPRQGATAVTPEELRSRDPPSDLPGVPRVDAPPAAAILSAAERNDVDGIHPGREPVCAAADSPLRSPPIPSRSAGRRSPGCS